MLAVAVLALALLTACGGSSRPEAAPKSDTAAAAASGVDATAPDGRGAIRPLPALVGCTKTATDAPSAKAFVAKVVPGDRICITGDLGNFRMKVSYSGTEQAPIQIVGNGQTTLRGIDVSGSNVLVDGFTVLNGKSPEISLRGTNVTLQNTVARGSSAPGGDNLYFFGDNIKIVHNTLGDNANDPAVGPNCMETFAADAGSQPSHNVLIEANRCENTASNCLAAYGPHAPGGTGQGETTGITFNNNYCKVNGAAAVSLVDVQNATITGNTVEDPNHAWSLRNNSTGAKIADNTLTGAKYETGMDGTSKLGYQGPPVGGNP